MSLDAQALVQWLFNPYEEDDAQKLAPRPEDEEWVPVQDRFTRNVELYRRLRNLGPVAVDAALDDLENRRNESPETLRRSDGRLDTAVHVLFSLMVSNATEVHADRIVALLGWHEPTVELFNDWRHNLLRTIGRIGEVRHIAALKGYAESVKRVPYHEGLYGERVSVEEMRRLDQQRIVDAIMEIQSRASQA